MMAVILKTVGLAAVIVLLCGVGSSSSRPVDDQIISTEAASNGFLLAASLTAIATICAVVALAVCTCCDGYEQFPGLSHSHQTPSQINHMYASPSSTDQDIRSVAIEPLPDVVNLQSKVNSVPPPTVKTVTQQNVARQDWEKFGDQTAEQQPMQSLMAPPMGNHLHDVVDEKGIPCSPIVMKQKNQLQQQHQLAPLHSTSTPDDEQKQQSVVLQQRASTRAPPPLQLDDDILIAPIATPALREAYERNRAAVLHLSDDDIRSIPPAEREERVYQFLTPEEIWALEGRIAASSVKPKRSMAPLEVTEWNSSEKEGERPTAPLSTLSDEHEAMRRTLLDLPDGQLAQMPLAEIESFFPYLTAEEILGVQERVKRLQSMQEWSMRTGNDSSSQSSSVAGRRRSMLTDASRSYLRSLHSVLSVRSDSHGLFIEDDAIADEANSQTAWEVREMLLDADDDSLAGVDLDMLSKAFVYLTPEEIADIQQRVMLAKESRRAMLLAATGTELRHIPAERLDSWLGQLEETEAATVRSRMEEPEENVVHQPLNESASSIEPPAETNAAALGVDYDAKANWRLTPNMSLSSSPDPNTQPFDLSGEPPIVQVSQSEQLLSLDESDEESKRVPVVDSFFEKEMQPSEATPMTESLVNRELPLVVTEHDAVLESARASSPPAPLDHPAGGIDDLEHFLTTDAPGDRTSADVSYESAVSELMSTEVFSTPSKNITDDEGDMDTVTVGEETVVGDLIDQVLEAAGAAPRTPTLSRPPHESF